MRLSRFFVVVAAAFLATGVLADSNVSSVNEPSHRNLRKHHHAVEDEERSGLEKIPPNELKTLAKSVGLKLKDVTDDAAAAVALSNMSPSQLKAWQKGLHQLKKAYKTVQYGRIKPAGS
ncbi:hypothetical protein P3T76_006312 [Phytophthora citrophthora]|uniref:RxLR effector protein n=1 Tax=Phytophthora citrophthora TaxID=4793 RepID=A0AAD9LM72_9STRA|nr:hypothetical protein P3T76_006312 [Phytophthora citrophthora]